MLIGLSGHAGSGKSTIANALAHLYGLEQRKFAAPLKDMLRQLLRSQGARSSEIERMIEGDLKEEPTTFLNGSTPRWAMQTLGTDWGRQHLHEDLWCDAAIRSVTGPTVFDDVRFENEAQAIRDAGGMVVRLQRSGIRAQSTHASEELPTADHTVRNDRWPMDVARRIAEDWHDR